MYRKQLTALLMIVATFFITSCADTKKPSQQELSQQDKAKIQDALIPRLTKELKDSLSNETTLVNNMVRNDKSKLVLIIANPQKACDLDLYEEDLKKLLDASGFSGETSEVIFEEVYSKKQQYTKQASNKLTLYDREVQTRLGTGYETQAAGGREVIFVDDAAYEQKLEAAAALKLRCYQDALIFYIDCLKKMS